MPENKDRELAQELVVALRGLFKEPLEDWVYSVREHEGMGWNGPRVKAYSDSLDLAKKAMKKAKAMGL